MVEPVRPIILRICRGLRPSCSPVTALLFPDQPQIWAFTPPSKASMDVYSSISFSTSSILRALAPTSATAGWKFDCFGSTNLCSSNLLWCWKSYIQSLRTAYSRRLFLSSRCSLCREFLSYKLIRRSFSIIAVHGLNGDPVKTWKPSESKEFWLKDYLPYDVPGARVLTFGYNADVAFGNTTAKIKDHAIDLLGSLIDIREDDSVGYCQSWPICSPSLVYTGLVPGLPQYHSEFSARITRVLAHVSAGDQEANYIHSSFARRHHRKTGIHRPTRPVISIHVALQALTWAHTEPRYGRIKDRTLGVVFFGTPHRGSDKAAYGSILANVATNVMRKPQSKMINALMTNSDELERLTGEFRFQATKLQILTFYEMKPMKIFSSLVRLYRSRTTL